MFRTARRTALALFGAALALVLSVGSVAASVASAEDPGTVLAVDRVSSDVDDFSFESFDADYALTRADDGTSRLRVVETLVALFPDADQNRGIRRVLPDTYNGQPLRPRLISVTDAEGAPRPAETDQDDGDFTITSRADGYLHGRQTFVITYELENVTWHFPGTGDDEFYWDVNGVDWPQSFGAVTATLHVPADLVPALNGQRACYRGAQGAGDPCTVEATTDADGSVVVAAGATGLGPHETMTIAVGFAAGTFAMFDSSPFASPWGWLQLVAALLALGTLVWAIVVRATRLRDAAGRPTIIAEYEPPASVDALLSAVLLGQRAKAVPAEILEQAVGGSIRIVDDGRSLLGKPKLRAELVDGSRADADGRILLAGLFRRDGSFSFASSSSALPATARQLLRWADAELRTRGLRRGVPGGIRAVPILAATAAGVLVFVFGASALAADVHPLFPLALMALAAVVFFVVMGLATHRPLSPAGAEARDHLRGLREFIAWAEADRIRMLQSPAGAERRRIDVNDPAQVLHLYETLLPYAVVFGQERQWSAQLAARYEGASPSWYVGVAVFDASAFSSGIGSLSSSVSSSTSGGAGGGGSAGGGGGGGGV